VLAVPFAAVVAANAYLYFAFYLPSTASIATNDPGIRAKSDHPDGYPSLEKGGI
jgi:hypothetical protein